MELYGTHEDETMLSRRLASGRMRPPLDVNIDARSVYGAIVAIDAPTPQDTSLRVHVISIADRIRRHVLRTLSWVYTSDMLACGLIRGGIDRASLMLAMTEGRIHKRM